MFGPSYSKSAKQTPLPKHGAFRPVANEHDAAKQDSSMLAVAGTIATGRGEMDSLSKESVYRRMEQKQRININKFGDDHKSQHKLMNFYEKQMGGVYDTKQMSKMYGIYQDNGEEKMFETIRPMSMQKGDLVHNNLIGEIGVLQDCQQRGQDVMLIFQDRSFRVTADAHGWSKKKLITTDESAPVAASSAAGPALFKEQVEGPQKDFVNSTMQKIIKEVDSQDDPHGLKNESEGMMKGMSAEKEHIDTAKRLFDHEITPGEAPFEIAKDHMEENPGYYSKFDKGKKGKEFLVKQDESEDEEADPDEDWDTDEEEQEFADMDMGGFAQPPSSYKAPSQSTRKAAGLWTQKESLPAAAHVGITDTPRQAKKIANFPHEQFHALAKQHNIPPGSKMKVTSFDKGRNQDVTHFGTYKGPRKDIGIPGPKYKPAQLHSYFNKSATQHIKTDSGSISHYKPQGRHQMTAVHEIPDVPHHEYVKGLVEQHKKTLESSHISDETRDITTKHIGALTEHLNSYKGEKGSHGPSEKMAKHLQHENSTMHLLGRHPNEDIATPYSDLVTAHKTFSEKYKRPPEAIVHTMPTGAKHKYAAESVSPQEKETHMKQLSSAPAHAGFGSIGQNKLHAEQFKESYTHGAYRKNDEGTHQRLQSVGIGKAGSHTDAEKGQYHGVFEHKAFPTNKSGQDAETFVKHRQYEHGSKRFNLESPLKQMVTKQKEMKAIKRIGGGSIDKPQPSKSLGTNITEVEKLRTPELTNVMGLKPSDISGR